MKTTKWTNYSLVMAGLLLFNVACSDSNSDSQNETTIRGSVEQSNFSGSMTSKSGQHDHTTLQETKSDVYAARVTESGDTQKIEGSETQTDDQGRYTLTVDMDAAQRVVIIAENSGQQLRGFVDASIKNGISYSMKPINVESTAEANVYTQLVKAGKSDMVSKADIDMAVDASAAARMQANPGAVAQLATSLGRAAEARAQFYSARLQSNASSALNKAKELHAKAQIQYESQLRAGASAADKQAALNALIDAKLNAYRESGLTTADASAMVDLWVRITMNGLYSAPDEIKNRLFVRLAFFKAVAMDKYVRAEAQAAGFASSTQQAIVDAGIKLRTTINTQVSTLTEIQAAFETWKNEVEDAIESDSSTEATVIITLNSEINTTTGASTTFHAAVNASATTSVVTAAYVTFTDTLKQLIQSRIQSGSEARVEAATGVLMMINF
jgi:predicted HicB family RNase H-like nuclease